MTSVCKKSDSGMFGTLIGVRKSRNRLVCECPLAASLATLRLLKMTWLLPIAQMGLFTIRRLRADPLVLPGFTNMRALLVVMPRPMPRRTAPLLMEVARFLTESSGPVSTSLSLAHGASTGASNFRNSSGTKPSRAWCQLRENLINLSDPPDEGYNN